MNNDFMFNVLKTSLVGSIGIVLILILRKSLFKKYTRKFNYYIWLIVIFRMLLFFEFPVYVSENVMVKNAGTYSLVSQVKDVTNNKALEKINFDNRGNIFRYLRIILLYKINYLQAVKYIWILGICICALYKIVSYLRYKNMVLDLSDYCDDLAVQNEKSDTAESMQSVQEIYEGLLKYMNINKKIILKNSQDIYVPMGIGIVKKYIIIPHKNYKKDDITWILKHELMHYKKNDMLYKILLIIVTNIYWFNPLIYIMNKCIDIDCELACDESVLDDCTLKEKQNYALTLINSIKYSQKYLIKSSFTTTLGYKEILKRRFDNMFGEKGKKGIKIVIAAVLIGVCSLCTMVTKEKSKIIIGEKVQADDGRIDLNSFTNDKYNGYYMIVKDPKRIKIGYSSQLLLKGETLSEIVKNNHAVAAVNGGGYSSDDTNIDKNEGKGIKPSGLIISDGKIIYSDLGNKEKDTVFAITKKGKMIVGKYSIEELKNLEVQEALSFYPALIIDGKAALMREDGGWGVAHRTAIAQRKDGSVILLVVDGKGISIKELQELLSKLGAVNAINLDGGKNSAMYYNGRIINNEEKNRYIPTAVMVK